MTPKMIFQHIKAIFFKTTKQDKDAHESSVAYAAYLCQKGIDSENIPEQLYLLGYCLGFVHRAVIGLGMYDRKELEKLQTMISGFIYGTKQ